MAGRGHDSHSSAPYSFCAATHTHAHTHAHTHPSKSSSHVIDFSLPVMGFGAAHPVCCQSYLSLWQRCPPVRGPAKGSGELWGQGDTFQRWGKFGIDGEKEDRRRTKKNLSALKVASVGWAKKQAVMPSGVETQTREFGYLHPLLINSLTFFNKRMQL